MIGSALVAVVAAVLCPHEVVLVDVGAARIVERIMLPGEGAAIFAGPDGRVLVPLTESDATAVLRASGPVESWRGRLFPLFFDEPDRMHVLMPGRLVTLSYPERLPLIRVPITGVRAFRRAVVSRDGRLVIIAPEDSDPACLLVVAATEGGTVRRVALAGAARALALARSGQFVVAVTGPGRLEVAEPGADRAWVAATLEGTITAVACTERDDMLVAVAGSDDASLVGMKVDLRGRSPWRERFRTPTPGPISELVTRGEEVVGVAPGRLLTFTKRGRKPGPTVAIPGASGVALLPEQPTTTVPAWSDTAPGSGSAGP
jgi:hypothetical protein